MRCKRCSCYRAGSVDMNCINGKCKCKAGFKGRKCNDRDCVASPWKWLSTCECGPGKTRLRSRHVVVEPHGNGKKCVLQENVLCGIKCQCGRYEFGHFCENQHCAVGPWSDPCKNFKDESGCTWGLRKNAIIYFEYKHREVTHERRGTGDRCPKLSKRVECITAKCITFKEWFYG